MLFRTAVIETSNAVVETSTTDDTHDDVDDSACCNLFGFTDNSANYPDVVSTNK